MTLTLLDLYNSAASQEWSMYEGDAAATDDMEKSLVIAINKAVTEILYSYPFSFRERTHVLFTIPNIDSYEMPTGIIMKDKQGEFLIKINSKPLKLVENSFHRCRKFGIPQEFSIKGDELMFYPVPSENLIVTIDYLTLAIGENSNEEEIYALKTAVIQLSSQNTLRRYLSRL